MCQAKSITHVSLVRLASYKIHVQIYARINIHYPVMASPFNHFTSSWFISQGKKWLGKRGERILDSSSSLFHATQLRVGEERERNILFKQFTCYCFACYALRYSNVSENNKIDPSDERLICQRQNISALTWILCPAAQIWMWSTWYRKLQSKTLEKQTPNDNHSQCLCLQDGDGKWQRRWQMKTKSLQSENNSEACSASATHLWQIGRKGEGLEVEASFAETEAKEASTNGRNYCGCDAEISYLECNLLSDPLDATAEARVAKQCENIFSMI